MSVYEPIKLQQIRVARNKGETVIWISRFPFEHDHEFVKFTKMLMDKGYILMDLYGESVNINNTFSWLKEGYDVYLEGGR